MIFLVSGFVKSTCYMTKPKWWVCLDSTPVASAVLGLLLWLQIISRYSCDIYYQSLWLKFFVNCQGWNLELTLRFFFHFCKLLLALHEFLQLSYWKILVLPFVGEAFGIVQGYTMWMERYILSHLGKFTCTWPNFTLFKNHICPWSLVCFTYSGVNTLEIPSVLAFSSKQIK